MSKSIYGKTSVNLTIDNLSFLSITANDITTANLDVTNVFNVATQNVSNLNASNINVCSLTIDEINISSIDLNELNVSNLNASNFTCNNDTNVRGDLNVSGVIKSGPNEYAIIFDEEDGGNKNITINDGYVNFGINGNLDANNKVIDSGEASRIVLNCDETLSKGVTISAGDGYSAGDDYNTQTKAGLQVDGIGNGQIKIGTANFSGRLVDTINTSIECQTGNIYTVGSVNSSEGNFTNINASLVDLQNQIDNIDRSDLNVSSINASTGNVCTLTSTTINTTNMNASTANTSTLTSVTVNTTNMNASTGNISTLTSTTVTTTNINASNGNISSLDVVTINSQNFDNLVSTVNQNSTDIDSNEVAIANLNTSVSANYGQIQLNAGAITQNANDIATNTTAISNLNTSVSNLNTSINGFVTTGLQTSGYLYATNICATNKITGQTIRGDSLIEAVDIKCEDEYQIVTSSGTSLTKVVISTDAFDAVNISGNNVSAIRHLGGECILQTGNFSTINVSTINASTAIFDETIHQQHDAVDLNVSDLHASTCRVDNNISVAGTLKVNDIEPFSGNSIDFNNYFLTNVSKIQLDNNEGSNLDGEGQIIYDRAFPDGNSTLVYRNQTTNIRILDKINFFSDTKINSCVNTPIANYGVSIANISAELNTAKTDITTNATNITTNTNDISTINTTLTGYATNFTTSNLTADTTNSSVINSSTITTVFVNASTGNISTINNTQLNSSTVNASVILLGGSNLQTTINSIETDITTNANNIATNTTDIATNTTNIATNTTNIATNTANIATNTANIATNTANIATNTTDIATNTTDIATNATNIATNSTNITTNTNDISTINTTLTGYATSFTTTTLNATTANISTINASVKNVCTINSCVKNTAELNASTVNASVINLGGNNLQTTLDSIESDVTTNTTNIATNTTNIATNTANIATNTTDIATNATDIATNATNIATNAGNITSNSNDISAINTTLTGYATSFTTTTLNATTANSSTSNISTLNVDGTSDFDGLLSAGNVCVTGGLTLTGRAIEYNPTFTVDPYGIRLHTDSIQIDELTADAIATIDSNNRISSTKNINVSTLTATGNISVLGNINVSGQIISGPNEVPLQFDDTDGQRNKCISINDGFCNYGINGNLGGNNDVINNGEASRIHLSCDETNSRGICLSAGDGYTAGDAYTSQTKAGFVVNARNNTYQAQFGIANFSGVSLQTINTSINCDNGDIFTQGNVNVSGNINLDGTITATTNLNVSGNMELDGTLTVDDDINCSGNSILAESSHPFCALATGALKSAVDTTNIQCNNIISKTEQGEETTAIMLSAVQYQTNQAGNAGIQEMTNDMIGFVTNGSVVATLERDKLRLRQYAVNDYCMLYEDNLPINYTKSFWVDGTQASKLYGGNTTASSTAWGNSTENACLSIRTGETITWSGLTTRASDQPITATTTAGVLEFNVNASDYLGTWEVDWHITARNNWNRRQTLSAELFCLGLGPGAVKSRAVGYFRQDEGTTNTLSGKGYFNISNIGQKWYFRTLAIVQTGTTYNEVAQNIMIQDFMITFKYNGARVI